MSAVLSSVYGGGAQLFNNTGSVLAGGKIYTYLAGTTTAYPTYTDSTQAVPNANPIILDSAGRTTSEIWINNGTSMKFVVTDSNNNPVGITWDYIPGVSSKATDISFAPVGAITSTNVQSAIAEVVTDLALSSGSSTVGYLPAGTGAVATTVQTKLRESVSVKDFGAVGNGSTDDSVAVYKAVDYAKSIGAELYFPAGVYRVTYGYTQSVAYNNIFLRGCSRVGEPVGTSLSSVILLDSSDASSYFMKFTVNGTVKAEGMNFKCAQAVVDRPFFKFQSSNPHFFYNCDFESVERPFVYGSTCYFQNAAYRDVQFRGSCGTFHSENTTLACTLMLIDNVNHESSVPTTNTEKIVCNLTGVRQILANNFLLEGALPAAGWTILKLSNPYDSFYTRGNFAIFNNYHSEWSGAYQPTYAVDQVGGNVQWNSFAGIDPAYPYKISSLGSVDMSNVSFVGTTADPATYFSLENSQCVVRLTNCNARVFDTTNMSMLYRMTQVASINDGTGQVVIDATESTKPYRWSGGYILADNVTSNYIAAGQSNYSSTDSTYRRKLVLVPDGSGLLNQNIVVPTVVSAGTQVTVFIKAKLPTFASGLWNAVALTAGAISSTGYSSTSGVIVDKQVTLVTLADLTSITITFGSGTTPGATGATNMEIYALEVFVGSQIPKRLVPAYPTNIDTYNSAVPTTGTWKVGDQVANNAPAAGQPKGWTCTVSGTPGTWVSQGNL